MKRRTKGLLEGFASRSGARSAGGPEAGPGETPAAPSRST